MKPIFLYFTTHICYNNAKPYSKYSNQIGHLIDKKNLGKGLLAQNIYKTRRFVVILTTMKHTFLLFTTVKCYVNGRVELTQKVRCPIDV